MVLGMLALLGLAGCAMDKEDQVRAQLDRWVSLGATGYFKSAYDCTAAVIDARSDQIKSAILVVSSVNEGLMHLRRGRAVAFDVPNLSPNGVTEQLMAADVSEGVRIVASGVAARNCMEDSTQAVFFAALNAPEGVLFFDPQGNALAVLDRAEALIFFARGRI